jgi:tetratricopeptide (TPR) repeat protein
MKLHNLLIALTAALALQTNSVVAQEAVWQSSYTYEAAGKYVDAMSVLDTVTANGPDAELKLLRRGWLFYLPGRMDESIREYRLAIERNPKSIDARLGLTLPLLATKRWREAEQASKAVLDLAPNSYVGQVRLATAQEGLQDWSALLKTASSLTTSFPTDATSFVYLARANAWLGKKPEALAAYSAVLARAPGNTEAKNYIDKK